MAPANLREQILAAPDLKEEAVPVPEWGEGVSVVVRELTGKQRDAFEADCRQIVGKKVEVNTDNVRAKLVVRCLYDTAGAAGARIFQDGDAEALGAKSGKVLGRLAAVAQRLSGLSDGDLEELAGN